MAIAGDVTGFGADDVTYLGADGGGVTKGVVTFTCVGVVLGAADSAGNEIGVAIGVVGLGTDVGLLDGFTESGSDATSASGAGDDQHSNGVGRASFGGGLYFFCRGTLLARRVRGSFVPDCLLVFDVDEAAVAGRYDGGRCTDAGRAGCGDLCSGVIGGW